MKLIGPFVSTPGEDIVDIITDEEEIEKPPNHTEICDLRIPISGRVIDIFV